MGLQSPPRVAGTILRNHSSCTLRRELVTAGLSSLPPGPTPLSAPVDPPSSRPFVDVLLLQRPSHLGRGGVGYQICVWTGGASPYVVPTPVRTRGADPPTLRRVLLDDFVFVGTTPVLDPGGRRVFRNPVFVRVTPYPLL